VQHSHQCPFEFASVSKGISDRNDSAVPAGESAKTAEPGAGTAISQFPPLLGGKEGHTNGKDHRTNGSHS